MKKILITLLMKSALMAYSQHDVMPDSVSTSLDEVTVTANYLFGDWQLKGSYAFPYSVLGIEGTKIHNPIQYGLYISWQRGNWAAECSVVNR